MINLKTARQTGNTEDFIKEHEADPPGDLDKFDAILKSATQGSGKAVPKASSQGEAGD